MGGELACFRASDYVPPKTIKQTDRSTHMALAACELAARDSRLDLQSEQGEIGMYFANQFGGMEFAEPELYAQTFIGPDRVSAYQAIAWFYAASQGQWSVLSGIRGFAKTIVADRVGGLQALGLAALAIQRGHCSVAFAGGFEAPLVPYTYAIYQTSGLLSRERENAERAYRPFDRECSGFVLAEAAAILVLEDLRHALDRGAPIYGEIAGFAANRDPDDGNAQLKACIELAVRQSGLDLSEVQHILPEGLGTRDADRGEADAIIKLFPHRPTVSVPKTLIGHAISAAGALDALWACLMMQHQRLIPTVNVSSPDPDLPLNHVFSVREHDLRNVLCCMRGFQGLNTALLLRSVS
jgi:3-oxoacyl-(acyl-carrier-protein) synthase